MDALDRCGALVCVGPSGEVLHTSAAAHDGVWALNWDHPKLKMWCRAMFGSFWGSTGPQIVIISLGISSTALQVSKTRHMAGGFGWWVGPYPRLQSSSTSASGLEGRHISLKPWEGRAGTRWLEGAIAQ